MFYESNQDIINKLSAKHRVNKDIVEACISHVFTEIKNKMGSDEYPNILIHGWGRFRPNMKYIKYKIIFMYKHLIEGGEEREVVYHRLGAFIKAYERLCIEDKRPLFGELSKIKEYLNKHNEQESKTE